MQHSLKSPTAPFSDSISKGMSIKGINKQVKGGRIYIKAFPGAKSTQFNHYVLPTLEEYSYDTAIINVEIDDILISKDPKELKDLPQNVIKVEKICQNYNIAKIFISGIPQSTRTNVDISNINKKMRELRKKNNFEFIEHPQINTDYLWNDLIHLQDTGKSLLGQNFMNRVSRFFCKNDSFLTSPHFQGTIR